jgi:hypothetical protein
VKDYAGLIDQTAQVLRTGGLLDLTEFDFRVYGPDKKLINLHIGSMQPPWFPLWVAYLNMAARQRGGEVDAANHLRRWVSQNPVFENVVYRDFFLPASPFFHPTDHNSKFKNSVGVSMRDNLIVRLSLLFS